MKDAVLERCQRLFPAWRGLTTADFDFDDPKGFSSFTMGVRCRRSVEPSAVLYRHLAGKENAILDFATERDTFLLLGDHDVAAHCYFYDDTCRIEEFYRGRTLTPEDLRVPDVLRKIADELFGLHQLEPDNLPTKTFFELLHNQWGALARSVLNDGRSSFPPDEQEMCDDLVEIYSERTITKVLSCLPDREPTFCHNDTYHGNVFLLDNGDIKLLDFEFSCLNHIAFDFANLFAETVMEHGLAEAPHFRIAEPTFNDADIARLIGYYLDNRDFSDSTEREMELSMLVAQTRRFLMLSDYMYAMAALPLSLNPIQEIRFIPYSHARFHKFLDAWHREFD